MANWDGTETDRRKLLKGLGTGALALAGVTGTATAEQANCTLSVRVEAGEGDEDTWTPRSRLTDDFRGRIDVSGLSSGTSHLAYMLVPVNPEGEFVDGIRSNVTPVDWSSGYLVHGSTWNPGGFFSWQDGTYYLYAVVAESAQESFGVAVSNPFEIRT